MEPKTLWGGGGEVGWGGGETERETDRDRERGKQGVADTDLGHQWTF